MGPSLRTLKFTDIAKTLDPSKVKEKRVSYHLMETLKRMSLQFMDMLVWRQFIKEKMVPFVDNTKIDMGKKFVVKQEEKMMLMMKLKKVPIDQWRTVKMLLKMVMFLVRSLLMVRSVLENMRRMEIMNMITRLRNLAARVDQTV